MFNSGSSFGKSANSSGDRLQPCKQMDEDPGDSCGLILRLLAQVLLAWMLVPTVTTMTIRSALGFVLGLEMS